MISLKAFVSRFFKKRKRIAVIVLLTLGTFIFFSNVLTSISDVLKPRKGGNLTIDCCNGRLGNLMGSYATLYGLAKLNNRQAVLAQCNAVQLKKFFEINLPIMPMIPKEKWIGHKISRIYNPDKDSRIPETANILTGYLYPASFTFFDFARQDIRKEFRFREYLRYHAEKSLREIKLLFDNATHLAFEYFRNKYKDSEIVFVVASDDLRWCRNNIYGSDVYISKHKQPAEYDLALLSHCNHSIISYGTYGFWSAYLAGGDTVYLANATAPGSWLDEVQPENTFYLPEWVGICDITPDFWKNFKIVPCSYNCVKYHMYR